VKVLLKVKAPRKVRVQIGKTVLCIKLEPLMKIVPSGRTVPCIKRIILIETALPEQVALVLI